MSQPARKPSLLPLVLMILVAAGSRLLPHPPNFTPLGAMALFGAATLSSRLLVFLVPLTALYLSDLVLNNIVYAQYHETFTWGVSIGTYAAFGLIIGLGILALRNRPLHFGRLTWVTITGTGIFFLVTNFTSWLIDPFQMYPDNAAGLAASYAAGLPFLLNSLLGNIFFTALLFGGLYVWQTRSARQLALEQLDNRQN